ncbi:MAG: globin domain-containing protein [Neomegalonema sp.]|nr:globin domain-containing protein [Neomegalonema sp.]
MSFKSPALSPKQVALVQDSFSRLAPKADVVAGKFYDALFRAHPDVRALFPADMTEQKEKLISTLAFVVRGLGDVAQIQKAVRDLGVRHRGYKASPAHYNAVGAALLSTLGDMLGPRWTVDLKDAWTAAYKLIAKTMIEAASRNAPA